MYILHLNQRNQTLFQYLRDKKKKKKQGRSEKGAGGGEGKNSPISPLLDPRLILICVLTVNCSFSADFLNCKEIHF